MLYRVNLIRALELEMEAKQQFSSEDFLTYCKYSNYYAAVEELNVSFKCSRHSSSLAFTVLKTVRTAFQEKQRGHTIRHGL